jgi:N-acetylglucosamine-6-phosphate deacetylase
MNSLLIKNVKIPQNSSKYADVLIQHGQIVEILPAQVGRTSDVVIDGTNLWLFPGFFDLHVHGGGGGTVLRGTKEDLDKMSRTLARFGTTQFLATTCFDSEGDNHHLKFAAELCQSRESLSGARIVGLYLEGPFLNPLKKGMIPPESVLPANEDVLDRIFDLCGPALKMMTIAPELPGAKKLIKKLISHGVIPTFGHSDASYEQTLAGLDAGIRHATHLFNGMRSVHHRDPGPIPALIQNPQVTLEFISDGAHIAPPVAWTLSRLVSPERLCLITDGLELLGLPDGDFDHKGRLVHARGGSVRYHDGTLVGTTVGQSELLSRFIRFTVWSIDDAVRSAAITPRGVLDHAMINQPLLSVGRQADLVLADFTNNQLTVQKTLVAGQIVYDRKTDDMA